MGLLTATRNKDVDQVAEAMAADRRDRRAEAMKHLTVLRTGIFATTKLTAEQSKALPAAVRYFRLTDEHQAQLRDARRRHESVPARVAAITEQLDALDKESATIRPRMDEHQQALIDLEYRGRVVGAEIRDLAREKCRLLDFASQWPALFSDDLDAALEQLEQGLGASA
jgi:septal ring factor EnvC (AmiA/AmiB activator)